MRGRVSVTEGEVMRGRYLCGRGDGGEVPMRGKR